MKKLMTVLASTAAALFAFGAGADLTTTGSSVEGSAYEVGQNLVSTTTDPDEEEVQRQYWYIATADGGDNGVVVSNYEASATTTPIATRPDKFKEVTNSKFLALDTSSPLYRTALPNSQNPAEFSGTTIGTDGIYLDTLVKFTAADDVFGDDALAAGDKIAISYVEQSDDVENPITNFVVRAGRTVGDDFGAFNYTCTVANAEYTFNKDDWHRLTVRTIANVGDGQVGFVIYLDGNMENVLCYDTNVEAGFGTLDSTPANFYNNDLHALFPSAVASGATGGSTISAASFSGTGAIDDIVFTTDKPDFIQEQAIVTIAWDAGFTDVTIDNVAVTAQELAAGKKDVQLNGTVVSVSYTLASGYEEGTFTGGTWEPGSSEGSGSFTGLKSGDTCTLVSMQPKFDVGGKHYDKFADALAAAKTAGTAQSPATIMLLANIDSVIEFTEGYIVLDLAGKTITDGAGDGAAIVNSGATLTIMNSTEDIGHVVPSAEGNAVVLTGGATVITGGSFDGSVYPDTGSTLVITGGLFLDVEGAGDAEYWALTEYVDGGAANITYANDYFTVGGGVVPPTPAVVNFSVEAAKEHSSVVIKTNDVVVAYADLPATLTEGQTYEVTYTADEGYHFVTEQGNQTSIVVSGTVAKADITITAPTAEQDIIGTYTVTVTPTEHAEYSAVYTVEGNEVAFVSDVATVVSGKSITITAAPAEDYEYATTPDGWTAGQNGVITIVVSGAGTVVIPEPTEKQQSTYPSYIDDHAAYQDAYDTWKDANSVADGDNKYEAAFLLNIAPDAADQTLEPASITIENGKVVITANQDLESVNGKVYIKTAGTLAGLADAQWAVATLDKDGAIEMTSNGTAAFFQIKVDF